MECSRHHTPLLLDTYLARDLKTLNEMTRSAATAIKRMCECVTQQLWCRYSTAAMENDGVCVEHHSFNLAS